MNRDIVKKIFKLANTIRGQDKSKVRKDPYGIKIKFKDYGTNKKNGWQIDHIKPASRGGSNSTINLQALHTKINISKGNTLVKKSRHNQKRSKVSKISKPQFDILKMLELNYSKNKINTAVKKNRYGKKRYKTSKSQFDILDILKLNYD